MTTTGGTAGKPAPQKIEMSGTGPDNETGTPTVAGPSAVRRPQLHKEK